MIPLGVLASSRVAPAGGGSWTPADLTLTAWFDPSDTDTITESGGAVSGLADKSGNGYHLGQATAAKPVTGNATIGGLNVLDFAGAKYLFRNSVTNTLPLTVAAVIRSNTATPAVNALISQNAPVSLGIRGYGINDWYMNAAYNFVSGTDADTNPHLLTIIANGASSVIRLDGVALATGNAGTNVYNAITIGGSNATGLWDGKVGEYLLVPDALSGSDLTSLETYLIDKWGI